MVAFVVVVGVDELLPTVVVGVVVAAGSNVILTETVETMSSCCNSRDGDRKWPA
jgi:hypothetical protein